MHRASPLGMFCHQTLSFSGPFMRMDRGEALFWPGCALMTLEPSILYAALGVLRRREPDMGISACCCGQPSRYLFPKRYGARRERLVRKLRDRGVKRIYTACPNCAVQLRALDCVEVIPLWQVLEEWICGKDLKGRGGLFVIHDPCPMRQETAEIRAIRTLCALAEAEIIEPTHAGRDTFCCGNIRMLHTTDPVMSAGMCAKRMAEFPEGITVLSCCEGCLGAFRAEGRETLHLLELLFGGSERRGWGNRMKFTFKE